MAKVSHYFAGSNTARGFYSLFHNIIGEDAKKVYLLKGGPGTGKSRLMIEIAQSIGELGYARELFFCSSEPSSLDAVSFPELGVAVIDATLPHALEAKLPGCRDELICLGNFWDSKVLERLRAEIAQKGQAKQSCFATAFRYFAIAHILEANIKAKNNNFQEEALDFLAEVIEQVDQARVSYRVALGPERKIFASALTPDGYISQIRTLVADYKDLKILTGAPGTGSQACLEQICTHARQIGLAVEVFPYPLDPTQILHLLIPELKMGFLTSMELDPLTCLPGVVVDFGMGAGVKENSQDQQLFKDFIDRGTQALYAAQQGHAQVESYYGECMDFAALDSYKKQLIAEIRAYKNLD